MKRVQNVLW